MSRYLRGFIRLAALAAVGVGCLMVAACGPGNSGGAAATASASGNPDPLASLSASEIAAKAIVNLEAASSLTMDGSLLISGQPVTVTLGIKRGEGCAGSIGLDSKGNIKLIVIGKTVYINPDDAYWKAYAGSKADAAIQWANGRYIKTTTSGSMAGVTQLCDLSHSLGSLKLSETMTKGKPTTLGGIKVLQITQGSDGWLYVSDTAKPELVGMEMTKGNSSVAAVLTFSPGAPVTVTAPPASDVVEGSAVGSS